MIPSSLLVFIGTVVVFVIPIAISLPGNPLNLSLPVTAILTFLGMLGVITVTYVDQHQKKVDLKKELDRVTQELETKSKELAETYIELTLGDIAKQLQVPGKVRTYLYRLNGKDELCIAYHHNMLGCRDLQTTFKPYEPLVGLAWFNERVVFDVDEHEKFPSEFKIQDSKYSLLQEEGVRSALYTPIHHPIKSKVIAVLGIDSSEPLCKTTLDKKQHDVWPHARALGGYLDMGKLV